MPVLSLSLLTALGWRQTPPTQPTLKTPLYPFEILSLESLLSADATSQSQRLEAINAETRAGHPLGQALRLRQSTPLRLSDVTRTNSSVWELLALFLAVASITLVYPHWATLLASAGAAYLVVREISTQLDQRTRDRIDVRKVSSLAPEFASLFRLYGMIAAADGLRRAEIDVLEAYLTTLKADASFRWDALLEFAHGSDAPEQFTSEANRLAHLLQRDQDWAEVFLGALCELTLARGSIGPREARVLHATAYSIFGSAAVAERFLAATCRNDAHALLGVALDATEQRIATAYDRKKTLFHADRLAARGESIEVQTLARRQMQKLDAAMTTLG